MRTIEKQSVARLFSVLGSGLILLGLSGCSSMPNFWSGQDNSAKRTVGQAMVREQIPLQIYTRPGAGGVGPDGKLVVASSARYHVKPKRPLDACGNPISPEFNSAELNDDQRTLSKLIAQQERQLTAARRTAYSANNPSLKDAARNLVRQNKLELEQLRHLRKQICKEAAHAIALSEKATRVR